MNHKDIMRRFLAYRRYLFRSRPSIHMHSKYPSEATALSYLSGELRWDKHHCRIFLNSSSINDTYYAWGLIIWRLPLKWCSINTSLLFSMYFLSYLFGSKLYSLMPRRMLLTARKILQYWWNIDESYHIDWDKRLIFAFVFRRWEGGSIW